MLTENCLKAFGKRVLPSLSSSSSSRSLLEQKWRHFATDVRLSVCAFSMSSHLICPWPEIFLTWLLQVCLCGSSALSRECDCLFSSLSHFQHLQILYKYSFCLIITRGLISRGLHSGYYRNFLSLSNNGRLITWMVVHSTAVKFKPLTHYFGLGLVLYKKNTLFVILCDFSLPPA